MKTAHILPTEQTVDFAPDQSPTQLQVKPLFIVITLLLAAGWALLFSFFLG